MTNIDLYCDNSLLYKIWSPLFTKSWKVDLSRPWDSKSYIPVFIDLPTTSFKLIIILSALSLSVCVCVCIYIYILIIQKYFPNTLTHLIHLTKKGGEIWGSQDNKCEEYCLSCSNDVTAIRDLSGFTRNLLHIWGRGWWTHFLFPKG